MRDVVLGFCKGEGIEVRGTGDGAIFPVTFKGESGPIGGLMRVDEVTGVIAVYTVFAKTVPSQRMTAVLELVARLNFGHVLGNLEIDVDSGALRFKTSLDVEGEEVTEGLVANCVYANIASFEQMLPALTAVIDAGEPVPQALQRIVT
ncbi:MAG TPA: YbjN domain-containing protein [Myxococcota bacterium]|jgi:hypothetical protein